VCRLYSRGLGEAEGIGLVEGTRQRLKAECGGMTPFSSTRHVASDQSADMSAQSKSRRGAPLPGCPARLHGLIMILIILPIVGNCC